MSGAAPSASPATRGRQGQRGHPGDCLLQSPRRAASWTTPLRKDKVNTTVLRASTRLDPTTGTARTASPIETPCLPEVSGLTQDEIRQIILDLIG
jgi:hypothetical protein